MRPSGRRGYPALHGAGEYPPYRVREATGVLVECQSGLLEVGGRAFAEEFSSFFCDRLVSTMTGMCMVAGFSFRAFSTFGPLILGQHHIEQDDVGQFVIGDLQGLLAVGGGADQVAGFGQGVLSGHPEKLAVLDQKHFGI